MSSLKRHDDKPKRDNNEPKRHNNEPNRNNNEPKRERGSSKNSRNRRAWRNFYAIVTMSFHGRCESVRLLLPPQGISPCRLGSTVQNGYRDGLSVKPNSNASTTLSVAIFNQQKMLHTLSHRGLCLMGSANTLRGQWEPNTTFKPMSGWQ